MNRFLRLVTVVVGMILPLSACSDGCRPASQRSVTGSTPAPTVWALVLDVQESGINVVSATPSRGNVASPALDEHVASVRSRKQLWIEYAIRSTSGDRILQTGAFPVSLDAIVEPPPGEPASGPVRAARRVVTVGVPYVSEPSSIVFTRVEPSDTLAVERWARVPIGKAELRGGAR